MGTYADLLKAKADQDAAVTAPEGSGRYAKMLGARKALAASVEDDYAQAKAQAEATLKQRNAAMDRANRVIQNVATPARDALSRVGLGWLAPDKDVPGQVLSLGTGALGPISGEVSGGIAAGVNALSNIGRRAKGQPTMDTGAVYRANRDVTDADTAKQDEAHRVTSAVGLIAGMKGAGTAVEGAGGLLGGLKPVAAGIDAIKSAKPVAAALKEARALKLAAQLKFNPAVVDWAENVAKGVASGGAYGAGLGATSGEGAQERGENAVSGAGWGGLTGGLLSGVVAPAAGLLGKGVKDLAGYVGGKLLAPPVEGAISPAEEAAARETVKRLAQRSGVTSANVAAKAAPYSDPIAGQMFGTQGQNLTGALARREGATGDEVRALQFQRKLARPVQVQQAVKAQLGYSPDEANDLVKGVVRAGQAEVAPMYAAAEESPLGLTRPDLEHLLKSNTGKRILAHVNERAKLQGMSPEGLTYGRVEVPTSDVQVHPMEAPPVGERIIKPGEAPPAVEPPPVVPIPRGPAEPPGRGYEFLQWLAKQGGVKGDDGGMAGLDLSKLGARSQNAGSATMNDLTMRARDEGYWPREGPPPTPDEFMEQVRASAGGKYRYAREPEGGPQSRYDAVQAAYAQRRALESEHVGRQADSDAAFKAQQAADAEAHAAWQKHVAEMGDEGRALEQPGFEAPPEGYGGQAAPQFEPAPTTGLTPRSLIRLHQLSVPEYENGRLVAKPGNLEQADFHNALGRILTGHPETGADALIPDYKAPKDVAQKYLGLRDSYDDFSGKLTSGTVREFEDKVAGLKDKSGAFIPEKLQGAQLAAINDVHELYAANRLQSGGKFLAPGVKLRLARLFTPEKAEALISQMQAMAEQAAAETRMAPFSGSPSAAMLQGMSETDQHAGDDLAKVGKLASKGFLGAAGDLIAKGGAYGRTAGSTVGYRDALGTIMRMKPPELEALLRELEAEGAPAPKASIARELGILGATTTQRKSRSSGFLSETPDGRAP